MSEFTATSSMQITRDQKLVKDILRGDEKAFRSFVDDYFPRLYRYARHRLGNESDVEEVVQTVLTNAARHLATFRGDSTLLTWLIQICRREISKQLDRVNRHSDMMTPFLNDDVLKSVVESIESTSADDPETAAQRGELITLIQFSLDQLPERYARVLELKYVEGHSLKEISEQLQTSHEGVQSLLARARRAFREICGEALRTLYTNNDELLSN
jgi:RNA polymerase sigma-70 factor (ECF subfamily)